MKTLAIGSIFVLFAIVGGISTVPSAFADHSTATVSNAPGSSVPGCEATNECYIPHKVTIDVGGEVTWSNDDTAAHTVTSGTPEDGPDGNFDSSLVMAGSTFSVKFDGYETGDYPYFCMVHPWMVGIVTVQAAGMENGDAMKGGELMVEIMTGQAAKGERLSIDVKFSMMDGKAVEHVNYNVKAMQGGKVVLDDKNVHDHDGMMTHMTAPLAEAASDAMPVDVEVTFNGFGIPGEGDFTGPVGKVAKKQVVPEFGTIAIMILAVAIVSIIVVSSRSKIGLVPKI